MPSLSRLSLRVCFIGAGTLVLALFILNRPTASSLRLADAGFTKNGGWFPRSVDRLDDVFNATLGFQNIFVINLPLRTDKRDAMVLSAAFSGLQIQFVDGVTEVNEEALPPGGNETQLDHGRLGAWRAHVDAIRRVVEQNLTSALILEDDADWDLRIKSQMRDFAIASRMLVQPLPGTSKTFLDPTYPHPSGLQEPTNFNISQSPRYETSTSPYGDIERWDVLWLGHCGCRFPTANDRNVPIGRVVIFDDETVPEKQHIEMQFGTRELVNEYPDHTRVVSRARVNTCTIGYGISQPGARRFLYELGVHKQDGAPDMMFRSVCDGSSGRRVGICLTVQPQLFQHHRPVGDKSTFSDISEHASEQNDIAFTRNVRWSTRLNLPKLVEGEMDWIDLFKDGEQADSGLGFRRRES